MWFLSAGMESVEYSAFKKFYSQLTTVFCDTNYLSHFVSESIISLSDVDHISSLSGRNRALCVLRSISAPLECGETQSFYKMLEIMQSHGNLHAKNLAENVSKYVRDLQSVKRDDNINSEPAAPLIVRGMHVTRLYVTGSAKTLHARVFYACSQQRP